MATTPGLQLNSGYRSAERNAAVGGANQSQHLQGNALDFNIGGFGDEQKSALLGNAIAGGARGIGIYPSGNSIHFDTRDTPTFWGPNPEGTYKGADPSLAPLWAQAQLSALLGGVGADTSTQQAQPVQTAQQAQPLAPPPKPDIASFLARMSVPGAQIAPEAEVPGILRGTDGAGLGDLMARLAQPLSLVATPFNQVSTSQGRV